VIAVAATAGNLRDNNFNLMSFLLAAIVLFSHAPELLGGTGIVNSWP